MSDRPAQPRVSSPGAGVVWAARSRRTGWLLVAAIFGVFALCGTWRSPPPGVNEPHYLAKSRHFWDREWCGRDLFLQSADVHAVFYATIGALTRVLSFDQSAWVGRMLVWLALAGGWTALGREVVGGRWSPAWAAALFAGMTSTGNLSGEWLIGGVEAKGFAYAALLGGLAAAARERWLAAAALAGIAVSFHPVVGGWGTVALGFALAMLHLGRLKKRNRDEPRGDAVPTRATSARAMLPPLAAFGLCSLPGLIPALALVVNRTPADVSRTADEIQVFSRLAHHLDPVRFSTTAWVCYGGLLLVWIALRPWRRPDRAGRLLFWFVSGTLLIAAGGAAIGFGPRWAGLLKFYPFRLADLLLPIAVAFELCRFLEARIEFESQKSAARVRLLTGMGLVAVSLAIVWTVVAPDPARNPTGWSPRQNADWVDACRWVAGNTPADALCLTPRLKNYTFKWHAGRAEYAIWKDCPQDAPSLVAWWGRLDEIHRWRSRHAKHGFDAQALAELHESTGIDYWVAWYVDRVEVEPVYRNRSFRVYRLPRQQ